SGLPVVCLNIGGPAHLVPAGCGIRLEPTNLEETTQALAGALTRLLMSPDLRRSLGDAAKQHVAESQTWSAKAAAMESIYAEVRSGSTCSTGLSGRCFSVIECFSPDPDP